MNNLTERYLRVKKSLFEKADADLNAMQRRAVYTTEGPVLVFAGAGSGKTTVLVRRVAQIIRYGNAYDSERVPADLSEQTVEAYEELLGMDKDIIRPVLADFSDRPCPAYNVLAITFTNKAANEIKSRLSSMFDGSGDAEKIWTGTFHSVCMRLIRMYSEEFGVGPGVTIYDTDDTKKALTSVMRDLDINDRQYPLKTVASVISKAKERLLSPEQYLNAVGNGFREQTYARIYEEYQRRLQKSNALDFDDIIMRTVLCLRSDNELRERVASRFRYICVDEYQDTNPAQFALCAMLASVHGNLMAVGDDDQSIYRFRGATVENILSYEKSFPGAKVIKLEQNYRSTSNILNAANAVIGKNRNRYAKSLWTESGEGEKITVLGVDGEDEEARAIISVVQEGVASGRYHYRDYAVLYRANAQANAIERAFARSGLPYRVLGGQRFNDRKEIKDLVSYLQLINNHADNVRLNRIVNEPKRKIGAATMEAVAAIAEEKGKSQFEIMETSDAYAAIARSADRLKEFTAVIRRLTDIVRDGCPLDAFIGLVLDMTGYRQMLIDGGEAEKERLDNVEEFISNAVEYMGNTEEATLDGFLEQISLVADVDKYDESADAVVMMTVHSAKGLEFPVTLLPGMEEGVFPSLMSAMDESELEEERRLAYVALTRAKKQIYIFHANSRLLYGRTSYNRVSRFVEDIPEQYTNTVGEKRKRTPLPPAAPRRAFRDDITVGPVPGGSLARTSAPRAASGTVFAPGDRVAHQSFGKGTVLSVKPMGGDRLYEIMFDNVGTKKLMGSYAKLRISEE